MIKCERWGLMVYSFADFKVEYESIRPKMQILCEDYISSGEPDLVMKITDLDIEYERAAAENEFSVGYLETIAFYRKLGEWLPTKNAFVMHSALFDVDGVGIAFAAHSGTGKTTHMRLWQELLGDKLKIVNGDKPVVRFFDNEPDTPYGYGTPWCGKEHMGCNSRTVIKHICFIERAEENSCEPMKSTEVIDLILNQVYMPQNPMAVISTMQLVDRLLKSCKIWKIKCNMDISAAETAYNKIFDIK